MIGTFKFERSFPWIGSVLLGLAVWQWLPIRTIDKIIEDLSGPVIESGAIAFGFVMTVTTLIISMEKRSAILALKQIGLYKNLLGYLRVAMYSWFFVCGATLILILLDVQITSLRISVAIWSAFLSFALLSTYRVGRILFSILSLPDSTTDVADPPQRRRVVNAGK